MRIPMKPWMLNLLLVSGLVLCSGTVFAQSFRGSIEGTVTDQSGAMVPGADVKATNTDTGLVRTATTNDIGYYDLNELPVGKYDVAVSKSGFKAQTTKGVTVLVSQTTRADATLSTGNATEVVTVTAEVPLIESTSNTMGGTIEEIQLKELPVNGRDFTKVLVMTPGSTGDPGGGADSPGSFGLFSSNGNRGRSNNYLLDGTDMNDGYRNLPVLNQGGVFATPSTILPVDALSEIPVLSNVEPEYGRNSGAVVNTVTKSGTNNWHGSIYEFFRNSSLDARNYFNREVDPGTGQPLPQAPFRNNQFGGSFGGPIFKDKTFFFFAYEGQREGGAQPAVLTLPTQTQISNILNGFSLDGLSESPVIANLLAVNPWGSLPASNGAVTRLNPFSNDADTLIFKIDHHIKSDVLTARYLLGTSDQSFPLALVGGGGTPGYNTLTPTKVHLITGSYTHVFNPNTILEARGGYNEFTEIFVPQDRSFDPSTLGLNTGVGSGDFGLPTISVSGYSGIGATASVPRGRSDRNYQFIANMSWHHGRHDWKFGYEFRRTTVDQFFNSGHRGTLAFSSDVDNPATLNTDESDPLVNFLLGNVNGFSRQAIGDTVRNTYQNNNSLYIQDSWKILSRLTLNYGMRWDYFGVIGESNNLFSLFDPATATVNNVSQLYPKDYNNFAPRISLAWDTMGNGKTVVRAGWGIYYDAFSQDFFGGQLPWPTFNAGPAFNGVGPKPVLFSFSPSLNVTGGPCAAGQIPVPNSGGQCADPVYSGFGATDVFTVDQRIRTPYIYNYNLNVEQEITKKIALQVGYVGSAGRKLFTYNDINQADASAGISSPYPAYFYILSFNSAASSNYNSLQTSLNFRNWHGFTSTMNYTWSHSIDDASDGQDYVPNATQPDNSYCRRCERANSNFDQRHHFVWNYHYAFPHADKWKSLLNGWGMDSVVVLNSGQPVNINYLFEDDYNGSGEFYGRPDLIGDPYAGTSLPNGIYNLAAFAAPCTIDTGTGTCVPGTQHFGSLGRNALRGPTYKNWDFSVTKDTKLGEKVNMQLRVDFFNILNHPNFTNPLFPNFSVDFFNNGSTFVQGSGLPLGQGLLTGTGLLPVTATPDVGFGNPFLGGGGPRNIQLAVRFSF